MVLEMPPKGFKTISIPVAVYEKLMKALEFANESAGYRKYRSVSQFLEALLAEFEKKIAIPRFEHFNVYEDHVTIWDHRINRLIDVYIRDSKLVCEYCKDAGCEHVKFVLTIPKVIEALKKRGWIIKRGKVVYVPP